MKKVNRSFICVILLLAFILRFWSLDKYPVGLFGDEVDVGYQAYSLLKTGKDYMGQFLPTYIHSLSEWRAPLFIYTTIPSIALFGLNEWGVRSAAAFFGVLGVLLTYLVGNKLWNEKVGLASAMLLTIMPWHIHYSRAAFEVTLLLDLILGGLLFYLTPQKNSLNLLFSAICFALSLYVYSTAVLFVPLFLLLLIFVQKDYFNFRKISFLGGVMFLILIPFLYQLFAGGAGQRFSLISIFSDDTLIDRVNIERSENKNSKERLFHNKFVTWGEMILSNYTKSFSPEFLFINGDPNPRHNVPQTGVVYWAFGGLLLAGWIAFIKSTNKLLLLGWLAISPLASSLTRDGGDHTTRLFLLIPPLVFLAAIGAVYLFEKKRIIFFGLSIIMVLNIVFYLHRYYSHYPLQQFKYWHYGFKESMQSLDANKLNYERVFINNTREPSLLHFLFWTKYEPKSFQVEFTGDVPQDKIYKEFNGFKLGKNVYFGEILGEPFGFIEKGDLYLAAQMKEIPGDWDLSTGAPNGIKVLKVIKNLAGKPVYSLITKQ